MNSNNFLKKTLYAGRTILVLSVSALLSSCGNGQTVFQTDAMSLAINGKGHLCSWTDVAASKDYFPKGQSAPLLALYKDSARVQPKSFAWDAASSVAELKYPGGVSAKVRIENRQAYLRFELLSVEPRDGVEAIVWGPYPVSLNKWIGETVGIVRDDDFAIGVQALDINTMEGLPDMNDDTWAGWAGMYIDPLPGQTLPDSLKGKIGERIPMVNVNATGDMPEYVRMYRGSAAVKKPYGSELCLFSRDRRIPRTVGTGNNMEYIPPADDDFAGSAIAVFGCPEPQTLDFIEKIELAEHLPHPTIDGVWVKRWNLAGQAYLMYDGAQPENVLKYAKAFDFKLAHIGEVFETWGHFGLKTKRFPNGAEDIKALSDRARSEGIRLGVHTLTMFTTVNDPYVSPVPSDSLLKTGSSVLTKDAGAHDEEIHIKDPSFFRNTGSTRTAKIGKELISYRAVSSDEPWRLLDCVRGQYGTGITAHPAGEKIDKLHNSSYNGFYPDLNLLGAYADRLADVCMETGIGLMDFDGFSENGISQNYRAAKFIDRWYKRLDEYRLTCGSTIFHYYWHIYTFMNWGEPWYNALRESQVNYRIENQRFFERNLMPGMLGWFRVGQDFRPEEIEWIQARSAGFDAGYLLRVYDHIETNGFKEEMYEAVREWQKARHAKAFTAEQRERMKNPKNEFHLEKAGADEWNLYPVTFKRNLSHAFREVQTGEPVASVFDFENPYGSSPVQFYVTAQAGDQNASVNSLSITFNDYHTIDVVQSLKAGDRLYCDGKEVSLCDSQWNKIRTVYSGKIPVWNAGANRITVKSEFSGNRAPTLMFELKSTGEGTKARRGEGAKGGFNAK